MNANELKALSALLDEAMNLDGADRDAWLAELESTSTPLAPALRDLLGRPASKETADLLDRGPAFTVPGEAAPAAAFHAGDAVGPYRLLRPIGQGGMGEVWLAERSDGQLKRQVALKLPVLGLRRSVLVQRFARERDIVGALAHPHIARLYDAGLADDGQPYLALEYVEGQTITAYCRAQQLDLRERVQLLLQVMDAVQYAHANLVIHRDLKPSNVLVTAGGQAMLLDFGIAKLLQADEASAEATELTQLGGRALTLEYAAPEQVSGTAVSTATDVYALGVLLYELLSGQRPFGGTRREMEAAILATEPLRPSALPPDLATIVLKALKKAPAERFATVNAMAEDLGRWLRGEPVLAQPDSFAYRLCKFIARRRVPVAAGSVAALALLVSSGAALHQADQARQQAASAARERDHALNLLARSDAVSEFLDMLINEAAQSKQPMTASELLSRSEALADAGFRHAPEQHALVLSILGMRYFVLAETAKAEALMQRAIAVARDSRDESFKARLGCQHSAVLMQAGRLDEARGQLSATVARSDIDPGVAAECRNFLAQVALAANDGPTTVALMQQAFDRLKTAASVSPGVEAQMLLTMASGLSVSGRNDEAKRAYARTLEIYGRLGREASDDAMAARNDWAVMSNDAGDPKTALALTDENLAIMARRDGGEPPAFLLVNRARVLQGLGNAEVTLPAFRTALTAVEREAAPTWISMCLLGMAGVALDAGDTAEAQRLLRRADALGSDARPEGSTFAREHLLVHARIALARGDLAQAHKTLSAVIADRPRIASTAGALARRAEVGLLQGQFEAAFQDAQDAFDLSQRLQGGLPYSNRTGLASLMRGRVLAARGDVGLARLAYELALQHLLNTVDAAHPALRQVRTLLDNPHRSATPPPSNLSQQVPGKMTQKP